MPRLKLSPPGKNGTLSATDFIDAMYADQMTVKAGYAYTVDEQLQQITPVLAMLGDPQGAIARGYGITYLSRAVLALCEVSLVLRDSGQDAAADDALAHAEQRLKGQSVYESQRAAVFSSLAAALLAAGRDNEAARWQAEGLAFAHTENNPGEGRMGPARLFLCRGQPAAALDIVRDRLESVQSRYLPFAKHLYRALLDAGLLMGLAESMKGKDWSSRYYSVMVDVLLDAGRLDLALTLSRWQGWPANLLCHIARGLIAQDDMASLAAVAEEVGTYADRTRRIRRPLGLVAHLCPQVASRVVEEMLASDKLSNVDKGELADIFIRLGESSQALQVLDTVTYHDALVKGLAHGATICTDPTPFFARLEAYQPDKTEHRVETLARSAMAHHRRGEHAVGSATFDRARAALKGAGRSRSSAARSLGFWHLEVGDLVGAARTAKTLAIGSSRDAALAAVVEGFGAAGDLAGARAVMEHQQQGEFFRTTAGTAALLAWARRTGIPFGQRVF